MRFSVAVAAVCLSIVGLASAAETQAAIRKPTNIPAEGLGAALEQFAKDRNLQVVFVSEEVNSLRTQGAAGDLTAGEALTKVLAGTGLSYKYLDADTVTVFAQAANAATSGVAPQDGEERSKEAGKRSSQDFRVAQVDQTSTGPQVSEQRKEQKRTSEVLEEVVVTGTHIRGEQPASPLITIDRDHIANSGFQTAGDVLRSLPQDFSGGLNAGVVGAAGSQNQASISGASTANLRGLGSESTLTLVDGQRLAVAEVQNAVDISLIPIDAIERVEVLTDGASAIYGSDAVGGVVNFIMRKNFDGFTASATAGVATEGGGELQRYDATAGKDWHSGHALISYEYAHQNDINSSSRDYVSPTLDGTFLLPQTSRNSVFLSAGQSFGSLFDLSVEGLYSARNALTTTSEGPFVPGELATFKANVHQYGVSMVGTAHMTDTWQASLAFNSSGNNTNAPQYDTLNGVVTPDFGEAYHSRLRTIEATTDGNLFKLPSGAVRFAAGLGDRTEGFSANNIPPLLPSVSASRDVRYAFAESLIPLVSPSDSRIGLRSLVLSVADRFERYSDFGDTNDPKVGLTYKPASDLQLSGTWSKAFRAPSLLQEHNTLYAYLFSLPPGGGPSPFLLLYGANANLQPERASEYTVDGLFTPSWLPGVKLELTYFSIDYRDRIVIPTTNITDPFADPVFGPFVTMNPSAALVESFTSRALFNNFSGGAFNPAGVAAIADDRYANASSQYASGVDLVGSYHTDTTFGGFETLLNLSYLDLRQKLSGGSPTIGLTGTVFHPPSFRGRAGITWTDYGLAASAFVNYVGPSKDPFSSPVQDVDSWTTLDAQLAYTTTEMGAWRGIRVALSATNLFDRKPPYVAATQSTLPGINYDATNASPVGRFVSLGFRKAF